MYPVSMRFPDTYNTIHKCWLQIKCFFKKQQQKAIKKKQTLAFKESDFFGIQHHINKIYIIWWIIVDHSLAVMAKRKANNKLDQLTCWTWTSTEVLISDNKLIL